ncbi:phospholipid-transporting ATPase ABCA1 [Maniola jurtina]|uniref:phospholipid-transporting ATPase ABCA1 n=1 Tax=Maniola jurtina TaxID=191418 RepID=UPI001E6885CC|nr:phospholipid-transporting ATPase ABCA1 [Maniola jurtina]
MAAGRQLRLLLWKDYLIRKRKPITLIGVLWAAVVLSSLYLVRSNVDNTYYPTCQFAARALPSAGVLNFLQSFVCNVNNECSSLEDFDEIPSYEKSRFTQVQRQISSIITNETVIDTAANVPDALKLLATLSDIADNPLFLNITKNGLLVSDIFKNPKRVKRYLTKELELPEVVSNSILTAEVGFEGIMQGNLDRCNADSISKTIKVKNVEHLNAFVDKLCALPKKTVQNLVMGLVSEVDIGKFVTMIGDMYYKLSGDVRLTRLGDMMVAALRMMSMDSFMPPELTAIIQNREVDFSYVNLTMIRKVINLFQPTFGDTESFKTIKEVVDTAVIGVEYLQKFLTKQDINSVEEVTDLALSNVGDKFGISAGFNKASQFMDSITNSLAEIGANSTMLSIFNAFSGVTNFFLKFVPKNQKHDVLFYSTLLAKLIEGAQKVININMHLEQLAYDVSLRNPQGVKILLALPPDVVSKGLEALANAERIQIMTSKLNDVNQMFCDTNRIKNFFLVSQDEASSLKSQFCTEAWRSYVYDFVSSFGIYDVKDNINSMASLFVLETLGRDTSSQLYTIDKDFEILRNLTEDIEKIILQEKPDIDWTKAFNVSEESEVLKAFKKKSHLGKHILITVHGALAKEVVSQNPLLEYKISPFLKDTLIIVNAINGQLDVAPTDLQRKAKEMYPKIIKMILSTALDEEKMYKTLSTPCKDILCNGPEIASIYLNYPPEDDETGLFTTLCNITIAIEKGLEKDSIIGKAVRHVKDSKHNILEEINWTGLITGLNNLYKKLDNDYTYLFEYETFNMNAKEQKEVAEMIKEVKVFWFDLKNLNRLLHISIKFGLRFLDILDHGIFDINSEGWFKVKYSFYVANGPLTVVDDLIQLIGGITRNTTTASSVPPTTATALRNLLPNIPYFLKDSVDVIFADNTDIVPIISLMNADPSWPCSGSLTQFLQLSEESQIALKSLETIMCLDSDLQQEWIDYLAIRNATVFKTQSWNTTVYPDSIFLKFSATFDSLIKDLDTIKEIFQSTFDNRTDGHVTLVSALQYSINAFDNPEKDEILRKFLSKVDSVLNAVNTSSIQDNVPLNMLWKDYLNCSSGYIDDDCRTLSRATWKHTLMYISTTFGNITEDLYTYFKESNEPNSTVLEALGFTRDTGLYMLYDKMPEFIAVLVNSYMDLGFMKRVQRASQTHFWDCAEVFQALNPGPDSPIDAAMLAHVQTFVCPSFLHWISMPRGDNKLIDIFTKPQYFFFTMEVSNLTSTYEKFYTTGTNLAALLDSLSNKSMENEIKLDTLIEKLKRAVDIIVSYEINDTEPSYRAFNEVNKKKFAVSIYFTRVVAIINKLVTALDNLKITDLINNVPEEEVKNLESELAIIQKIFIRRPSEAIALHFDIITDVLWTNIDDYKISNALTDFCNRLKSKDNSKNILVESDRVKAQICAKNYELIYGAIQNILNNDFETARGSLINVVNTIGNVSEDASDIFAFLNKRNQLVDALKTSVKYAYDLGIPIYLKYLQSNLQHYNILISFLSSGDWWKELRELYNGPNTNIFFDTLEKGFDITEDIFTHLDRIHLVRLIRDTNTNSTETFCQPNITISDYVPDSTGLLTTMHRQICDTEPAVLYRELPPMLFASQGYAHGLDMSKEVDYDALYKDLANTEARLEDIKNGPKTPQRPAWVTKERLERFREVAVDILSKESLIKISFGVLSNVVDAGTLYLNNSQCTLCSEFTSWFKQINLQLYKKQEYDNLLCNIDHLSLEETYGTLKNDFHWDMAVSEIKSILLTKLFAASNLTQEAGDTVLSGFGQMASLLPSLQDKLGNVSESLANEPLLLNLRNSSSFGDMLTSSSFMADAGNMLCGKPFYSNLNRLYKTVIKQEDLSSGPDQAQLDALPTDFCRSLYKDIISIEGGKIVWSFVKPLIVGKILYTPPNVAVQKIIEKANSTFAPMVKLANLVHSFANSFSSVDRLVEHREGLSALQNLIAAPQYSAIRKTLLGDVEVPSVDINGVFDEFGDTEEIGRLLKKASDLLFCINLNRFKPMPNEHELTLEAAQLTLINEFSAGLVFLNMSEKQTNLPANIEYKIRMDIENAPTTKRLRNYLWIPGPESSFLEDMRYFRGFVEIQDIIDKAIIQISMEDSRKIQKRDVAEMKQNDWAIYTQQIPYPCYTKDFFQSALYESQSLIVAFYFSLLFTVSSAVRFIVSDKETGNTMLMSVMGVELRYHTLSWFICSFVEMVVTVAGMTAVLVLGNILPRSDPSLIFTLLFIYGYSVLCFCYMMSKMFRSASAAAVCTGLAYLVSFMPFVLILSLEAVLVSSLKLFVSLSMSSSLCYGFLFITRFEAMGVGAGWSQIWEAPDNTSDMNIAIAGIMVLVDSVLYLIIGLLLDRFFGIKTQSNITNCKANGEKAGVSILNVTKIYDEGSRRAKLALDNVSMELHKGQITTLLGHNGAGKTTLINILTGMLKLTKGHVIVRSDDEMGARLGVCPQKNVLFEYMTAREHIALYAQLKSGQPMEEVQEEVKSMLHVLNLGHVCDVPVAQLSGGTRRRLCVALAFVARPSLVSLDEPTAGVDPAARRDIWSMIMKLRENRTILLTTHHLDEAELLSDQIIIMHKGQIHTTGSPIDIKRTLGSGYKLTVIYPDKKLHLLEDDAENDVVMIEEKTKNLLAVARSVVKNANLVDINGLEVEINLPFYDADGVSNDFLEMCNVLEGQESELKYLSYSLDCSSLEQVFFNICQQADLSHNGMEYDIASVPDSSSKSASTSSVKNDHTPLVSPDGPLRGSNWQQFTALMYARYLHYLRNRWLLFLLVVLPSLFLAVAMAFSSIRPPADAEVSLKLYTDMYEEATQFMIPVPSVYSSNIDPSFAQHVMNNLRLENSRNWTHQDSPTCRCVGFGQQCDIDKHLEWNRPDMMLLYDADTLNNWLVDSQQVYIEKRYAGFTSVIKNNMTHLVAWYNNKGHHILPAAINALNSAILRTVSTKQAGITVYTHPMKISKEQLNKDTVYQHIADAGISAMLLIAYSLVSAGAAVYLVTSRLSQEKHLQMLCGVSPGLYWGTALLWDMAIIVVNMLITAVVLEAFQFSVFVARNNLPAICILILLYGYACAGVVHVLEKVFAEASLATMLLFCGNAFIGLVGIALLLVLDIISESEATDNARWVLHKILLLSPQFTLGDGLLEIAKNTIQAEVLSQFNMDTYRDPLTTNVVGQHYLALALVGTVLLLLNLAIEYDCFDWIHMRLRSKDKFSNEIVDREEQEVEEIMAEATRVRGGLQPLRLRTIGNINAGFVDTEDVIKNGSIKRSMSTTEDVAACVRLRKKYGQRVAVHALTLGIPPGQCTALLGENGAGKSTTFSMLTGQLRPSSGQVYLHARKVSSRDLCQGLISYCPQSDAIDPLMTVKETLRLYCNLRGITDQKEVIRRTVELFELSKYGSVRSGSLSGGNKRKLCAALAFMGRAPLVLLDEPTSGMDPSSRACVSRGVRGACATSRGVVLSTHALDDARRLAARVALLKAGRLCALAPLDECLKRFGGGYVVATRVRRGAPRAVWLRVHARAPHAELRVLHHAALHFLIPTHATVNGKEIVTKLSDIFKLMAELQMSCDIEDYTVNQSSLDQMFLNFTERTSILDPADDLQVTPRIMRPPSDELDSITSL